MLIIAGKLYLAAERRDEYVANFQDFVSGARQEPGCLDVVVAADPIEPDRINLFELWETKEQMDAFRAKAEPPETDIEFTRDEVQKYEISSVAPPFP